MRSSRAPLLLALAAACLAPGTAWSQEEEGIALQGVVYGGYTHSFQDTGINGDHFNDGNGTEIGAGFQAGDYLQFLVAWEWQGESDYDTHFIPFSVRMLSPSILDRVHLYGEVGLGLLFSRLHNEFNAPDVDAENERGAAVRLRGGVEVGITESVSAIAYSGYLWGLGSADDYEYLTVGAGLQYRWGL